MEVLVTALVIALSLLAQQPDPSEVQETAPLWGVLFHASGSADIRHGIETLNADSLTVFPQASYSGELVRAGAVASIDYATDTTGFSLQPVSAGVYLRWPGSPWIAAGISMGEVDPFHPGMNTPVREWKSCSIEDSTAVSLEAGGLLGFDGVFSQFGDSLSVYGVNSPWLGFGTVGWNKLTGSTSTSETVSGFLDLRKVSPWFLFAAENSKWTYLTEIRGLNAVRNRALTVEVVPRLYIGEDSSTVQMLGYLSGNNVSISGSLGILVDIENDSELSLSAGMEMLSRAGIAWSAEAELAKLDEFRARLEGVSRMSPAGFGGSLDLYEDSLRVTATALYSPVAGVSADLSVMSDLSTDSPDPGCFLRVFGARQNCTAAVIVEWKEGSTSLGLEVSAWLN